MSEPIAVTVIGGYLGAGKTTLVNHILRTADERLAVLVNDFGDVDIDADLIDGQDGQTMSLANGCICCSLVDGLAAALTAVTELKPRPERLVIEASGVADPATVAAYGHGQGLQLDAVIVLADAETVRARSHDTFVGDTVRGQLRSADVLVLNKVDLVVPSEVALTRSWLHEQNPDALVVEAVDAAVAAPVLFGVVDRDRAPTDGDRGRQHDHAPDRPHGAEVFESWSWWSSKPVPRALIEDLMSHLPESVVRAKGVLRIDDEPGGPAVLQRVGRRWTLRVRPERAGESTGST